MAEELIGVRERGTEEAGLESFAIGQTPTSAAITDVNSIAVAADPDRAYCVVTLLVLSGGAVFFAQNAAALADNGQAFDGVVGQRIKLFGPESVQMINGTPAQTATIGIQTFKRGFVRQGTAV